MENASKALIIAGAILISLGILLFNSAKGLTDNAETAGDEMELAAARKRAEIILSTMDINDDNIFNNYLMDTYGNRQITAEEARILAALITERCKRITGAAHSFEETHITSNNTCAIHHYYVGDQIIYNLDENKLYSVTFGWGGSATAYSVQINEV